MSPGHAGHAPSVPRQTTPAERPALEEPAPLDPRTMDRLMRPRSVAVVGAATGRSTAGRQVLERLRHRGFAGRVYAVSRTGTPVGTVPTYATVQDLPEPVDLALLTVPPSAVPAVARDCARAGAGALVVLSDDGDGAGAGPSHAHVGDRLRQLARETGVRSLGPGSLGVANTSSAVHLDATVLPWTVSKGSVALVTQGSAVATAVAASMEQRGIGLSHVVSLGAAGDVGVADVLPWLAADRRTRAVAVYLEDDSDLTALAQAAEHVERMAPVVLLDGNRLWRQEPDWAARTTVRTRALQRPGADLGLTTVSSIRELSDTVAVLASQPVPRGRRVVVVANCSGPARLALQACTERGLVPARHSSVPGYVALDPGASPGTVSRTLRAVAADAGVDAVLAVLAPGRQLGAGTVGRLLDDASRHAPDTTFVACVFGAPHAPRRVPLCDDPVEGATVLATALAVGERRRRPRLTVDLRRPELVLPSRPRTR